MQRIEIALIGAPGSGKTDLAEAFADISRDWFSNNNVAPLAIADTNRDLEVKQGRLSGPEGDHFTAMAAYFNRVQLEDRIRVKGDSLLAVGSVLDAIAHINVRINNLSKGLQTPDLEGKLQRELLAGQLLQTYLMDRRWLVNYVWYLPTADKIVIPGQESKVNDTYNAEVDAILQDINLKMSLGIPILTGTTDQRANQMLDFLKENFVTEAESEDVEPVEPVSN